MNREAVRTLGVNNKNNNDGEWERLFETLFS